MSRICPVCHQESPPEARYCFDSTCLAPLDPVGEPAPDSMEGSGRAVRRRRRRWPWAAMAVVAAGAVGGAVLLGEGALTSSAAKSPPKSAATTVPAVTTTPRAATPSSTPPPSEPPRGTPIDPKLIAATAASSTLPDQDGLTYGIGNTLDGQLTTAWNSAGSTPGKGVPPVGQTLTYTLSSPQHIVGVRIVNGFNPNDGKHQFTDNHRVQTLGLRAAGQERDVDLADSFSPQFVAVDFPNADSLELDVLSVYPTTKWPDVALTEVQIFVTTP